MGGIKGSYVISPFWSLEWGIAWEAQQGSTLSPTGASEKGLPHMGDVDKCHGLRRQKLSDDYGPELKKAWPATRPTTMQMNNSTE